MDLVEATGRCGKERVMQAGSSSDAVSSAIEQTSLESSLSGHSHDRRRLPDLPEPDDDGEDGDGADGEVFAPPELSLR